MQGLHIYAILILWYLAFQAIFPKVISWRNR